MAVNTLAALSNNARSGSVSGGSVVRFGGIADFGETVESEDEKDVRQMAGISLAVLQTGLHSYFTH